MQFANRLPAQVVSRITGAAMTRALRNDIASATVAICPASFGAFLWLFFAYFSSHPTTPNDELGLVYKLSNHGSYVYLSATESTGLALLMIAFVVGLVVTLFIVPKDYILPPPGTPRWMTYVGGTAKTDLAKPTPRLRMIFLGSLVFCLGVIYFAGPWLAKLMVARGIVLHF